MAAEETAHQTFQARHLCQCFAIRLFLGIHMKLFVVFAPFIAAAWDIPLKTYPHALVIGEFAGMLTGFSAPVLGKAEPWHLMMGSLCIMAFVLLGLATAPSLSFFWVERFVFGQCRVLVSSSVTAAIGQRVAKGSRGRVVALIEASYWISDMMLPLVGLALSHGGDGQDGSEALSYILLLLASGYSVLAFLSYWLFATPRPIQEAYVKLQSHPSSHNLDIGVVATIRGLARPGPLGCILWPLCTQVGQMGVFTVLGIWLHQTFEMSALGVGLASLALAVGEAIGFALNLMLTDRIGSGKVVGRASVTLLLGFATLSAQGLLPRPSLWLALASVVCIYAASETAFVASMSWVMDVCPESDGISQLVMSVTCRSASGMGRCIGTLCAFPVFTLAGLTGNAVVATTCCVASVACVLLSASRSASDHALVGA